MKDFARSLIVALPMLIASVVCAQRQTFTVAPDASQVAFSLGGTDHTTHGTFHVTSGAVDFDLASHSLSGSVVVSAPSGETGNKMRDRKMTAEVLDAPHFAEVSFAPRSFEGTLAPVGDSTVQVTGTFTLHGAPHELTVPMQIHIEGSSMTAKAHFPVPYVQWGLKDPSIFLLKVAKEVGIDLTLAGSVSRAK